MAGMESIGESGHLVELELSFMQNYPLLFSRGHSIVIIGWKHEECLLCLMSSNLTILCYRGRAHQRENYQPAVRFCVQSLLFIQLFFSMHFPFCTKSNDYTKITDSTRSFGNTLLRSHATPAQLNIAESGFLSLTRLVNPVTDWLSGIQ